MQIQFLTASLFAIALAAASSAAAEELSLAELLARGACPEMPVCGSCKADIAQPGQGESSTAAETEHDRHVFVNNANGAASAAPPAPNTVAPPRGGAATAGGPLMDGVVVLSNERPQPLTDGLLILRNSSQPRR